MFGIILRERRPVIDGCDDVSKHPRRNSRVSWASQPGLPCA